MAGPHQHLGEIQKESLEGAAKSNKDIVRKGGLHQHSAGLISEMQSGLK